MRDVRGVFAGFGLLAVVAADRARRRCTAAARRLGHPERAWAAIRNGARGLVVGVVVAGGRRVLRVRRGVRGLPPAVLRRRLVHVRPRHGSARPALPVRVLVRDDDGGRRGDHRPRRSLVAVVAGRRARGTRRPPRHAGRCGGRRIPRRPDERRPGRPPVRHRDPAPPVVDLHHRDRHRHRRRPARLAPAGRRRDAGLGDRRGRRRSASSGRSSPTSSPTRSSRRRVGMPVDAISSTSSARRRRSTSAPPRRGPRRPSRSPGRSTSLGLGVVLVGPRRRRHRVATSARSGSSATSCSSSARSTSSSPASASCRRSRSTAAASSGRSSGRRTGDPSRAARARPDAWVGSSAGCSISLGLAVILAGDDRRRESCSG